ncbi:MAG TPA: IS1634 family transposase [Acidobacteriota bacterium]|nr:IS1634 family transposase [Acidobacteriota bacterium]
MPSLQAYTSHGHRYYRIVESYRREGKPRIRVLAHLGKVEDLLELVTGSRRSLRLQSKTAGAVTALDRLAVELDLAGKINRVVESHRGRVQVRDGLTVGQSLVAAMIARACAPSSKRAFQQWAEQSCLPELMGFEAPQLTSQHFWDQMQQVPEAALPQMEASILTELVRIEQLELEACLYDTTNFYTYLATENGRSELAQRGHNKQRRHDLRQLGLALVVDRQSHLPLFHHLYEGSRNDARTLGELIAPIRKRLKQLKSETQQSTLVFDAGASSTENLNRLGQDYVVALRPSDHKQWLETASARLTDVVLSTGKTVRAYRECRQLLGAEREVVAMFSEPLYQGQVRGLDQQLRRAGQELEKIGTAPLSDRSRLERRLNRILDRQYLRDLIRYEWLEDPPATPRLRIWSDLGERRRLLDAYFGLRLLATSHQHWATAEIIEAYHSQSKVEAAFRDLKDPGMISTRPQFHWTDQKLRVHAFLCVMAYLLVRLLWWRYRRQAPVPLSPRSLLAQLKKIRIVRVVELTGKRGRPRLHCQLEEMDQTLRTIGELTRAFPSL